MNPDSQSERVQDFLSSESNLFVIAKKNSTVRVFILEKKLVDKHQHEELNDVMKFAEEITASKIPEFVREEISK